MLMPFLLPQSCAFTGSISSRKLVEIKRKVTQFEIDINAILLVNLPNSDFITERLNVVFIKVHAYYTTTLKGKFQQLDQGRNKQIARY
ncbi:unknown protein [Microcystis aeruginosa NIES-843]|uniref:Uncharacterized protein n=1 Tax=Microcystis aeruginosa (strain NIES-843 / IAM M-2473) TaxID=449447 RepID=B0JJR8_MICAN|nr:unknown protein [Microcystis aeruginosa NIES-843]